MKRETKFPARLVVLDSNDPISAETEEIQSRIRERAYELSQERGHAGMHPVDGRPGLAQRVDLAFLLDHPQAA